MKSSILGMFQWTPNKRSSCKTDLINPNSSMTIGLPRPTVESDTRKETAGLSKANKAHHYQSNNKQRKMPPLLRLNSEGEISSGKHFCDKAVSSQFDKINSICLSNSFDSSYINKVATPAGSSFESPNSNKSIPCPPSFKKSLSDPSGSPFHQSYPPPSSPSAIIRNHFSSPMAEKFSPYSPSPRVLGNVNIFKVNSQGSEEGVDMAPKCAISSSCRNTCLLSGRMDVLDSPSLCKNVRKLTNSKLNAIDGDESSFSVNCDSNQSISSQASTSVNCSSQNTSTSFNGTDSSSVLFIQKKKKKRSRNRRKKEMRRGQDKESTRTPFRPSSCSSPLKDNSHNSDLNLQDSLNSKASTSGVFNVKIVSPICHIVTTPKKKKEQASSPVDTPPSRSACKGVDCSVDDDGLSDDDLVFEDGSSVVFFDNSSPSLSKSTVSLKGRKSKKDDGISDLCESDDEQKSSSSSGLHFTLSVTVSEDEDNDSGADWDMSASPSENDQFVFEFEFNTGLCLDSIMGHVSTTECPETKAMKKQLRDVNLKWKKAYVTSDCDEVSLNPTHGRKVNFASEEDLTTVHLVGNEDRAGEWHHYALERTRFQRRIDEVGKVLAPVLSENHRAKVLGRIVL